jgi:hypothetical protein
MCSGWRCPVPRRSSTAARRCSTARSITTTCSGAERLDSYVQQNDAKVTARLNEVPAPSRLASQLEGFLMDEQKTAAQTLNDTRRQATPNEWPIALASLPVLGLLLAWRHKRRRLQS